MTDTMTPAAEEAYVDLFEQIDAAACATVFGFDLPDAHVTHLYDEYCYDDFHEMLSAHTNWMTHPELGFHGTDPRHEHRVLFETYCAPSDFPAVQQAALDWLMLIQTQPRYCTGAVAVQHALDYAEHFEQELGITKDSGLSLEELVCRVAEHEYNKPRRTVTPPPA